jgi:prepilin-type N-terminal cleavage/methylation domain-containing protein
MRSKKIKGLTLIELLVALVISSILIAALYRLFIREQNIHISQERVVDTQQNARIGINRMMREIRMAAFGNVAMVLPVTIGGKTFKEGLNPDTPSTGNVSIVLANEQVGTLTSPSTAGQDSFVVTPILDPSGKPKFDTGNRQYISIGGVESQRISSIIDAEGGKKRINLNGTLSFTHRAATPVFGIRAITYRVVTRSQMPSALMRDDNLGGGGEVQADNIQNLQLQYFDASGGATTDPELIRLVRVSLTSTTEKPDPVSNQFLTRQLTSNIHLKDMGLDN